ncbi:MAG: amidohydrolase [Alphaproteobacteria bacterium]|nr:amidohydrolase [Alphaproteobacteria bacterium]
MPIVNRIAGFTSEMAEWRHHIHAHPETAFEEHKTSDYVAAKLESFGLTVHRGLAGTGVVATLKAGKGKRAIGLRADMDALHVHEENEFAHRSTHQGKMHACGHDGHTTMLLGAAKYLSETRNFDGTVHFIFQPAEENEGGGRVMVEQGLFDKFPVEAVYGMHNMPGLPVGKFATLPGPMMAAFDIFELTVTGHGSHAAQPQHSRDPVVAAAAIVQALQTLVSRNTDPQDAAVVSVTQIHAGDTWNVIPERAVIRGTCRWFKKEVGRALEAGIRRVADGVAQAFGAKAALRYERRYPATVNTATETAAATRVAREVAGGEQVVTDPVPVMGSEDFAFMLQAKPGSYVWIGNGMREGGCMLHNPRYDFNDDVLPLGASYWARLVETELRAG